MLVQREAVPSSAPIAAGMHWRVGPAERVLAEDGHLPQAPARVMLLQSTTLARGALSQLIVAWGVHACLQAAYALSMPCTQACLQSTYCTPTITIGLHHAPVRDTTSEHWQRLCALGPFILVVGRQIARCLDARCHLGRCIGKHPPHLKNRQYRPSCAVVYRATKWRLRDRLTEKGIIRLTMAFKTGISTKD